MFGRKKSPQDPPIGGEIEFDVDTNARALCLATELQMQTCVERAIVIRQSTVRVIFREHFSSKDKQPVADLITLWGIQFVS